FVHHDVATLQHAADRFAGLDQRCQVRAPSAVDRRGDGHDVDSATSDCLELRGETQAGGRGQLAGTDLERAVTPVAQFGDASGADVESERVVVLAELDRERQAD